MTTNKKKASILKSNPEEEVPFFLNSRSSSVGIADGNDWIMFPNGMLPLNNIVGNEPIMLQPLDTDEPSTITIAQLKTWMTGELREGDPGFVTGAVLSRYLTGFVSSDITINGHNLVGDITLTKEDIGLGNVDNTSDEDKPMSRVVRDKFDEIDDFHNTEIRQLTQEVSDIGTLLDSTVSSLNNTNTEAEEFKNEFDDHLVDPNAHTDIRTSSIINGTNGDKLPTSEAVYSFVSNFIRNQDDLDQAGGFIGVYSKTTNKAYRLDSDNFYKVFNPQTLWSQVVNNLSQFPDTNNLNPGTIVRIGNIALTDPMTGYSASPYEIIVWDGTQYKHLGYTNPNIDINFNQLTNGLGMEVISNGVVVNVEIPKASPGTSGIITPDVLAQINGIGGLSIWGTPANSWEIGLGKSESITIGTSGRDTELRYNGTDVVSETITDENGEVVRNPDAYANLVLRDITILGNVTQKGNSYITEAETVKVSDNMLTLNSGEKGSGVTAGRAGIEIDRGTSQKFFFIFDETDDRFKVGAGEDLWPVMIRDNEPNLIDGYVLTWDATKKMARTGLDLSVELAKYLPLTAGSGNPLTGPLYITGKTAGAADVERVAIIGYDEMYFTFGDPNGDSKWTIGRDNNWNFVIKYGTIGEYPSAKFTMQGLEITSSMSQIKVNNLLTNNGVRYLQAGDSYTYLGKTDATAVTTIFTKENLNLVNKDNTLYKVWHSGNDGSGSGLDADLLDGKHASEFALASGYLPLTGGTVTGVTTFENGIILHNNPNISPNGWYVDGGNRICAGVESSGSLHVVAVGNLEVSQDGTRLGAPANGIATKGGIISGGSISVKPYSLNTNPYASPIKLSLSQDSTKAFYDTTGVQHWFNKPIYVAGDIYGGTSYDRRLAYVDEAAPLDYFYTHLSLPVIGHKTAPSNELILNSSMNDYHINYRVAVGVPTNSFYFHAGSHDSLATLYARNFVNDRVDLGASWVTSRNMALLINSMHNTRGYYYPTLSMKGISNSVEFGMLVDDVFLSFVTDVNYANGYNDSARIKFTPEERIYAYKNGVFVPFARIDTSYVWTAVQDFSQGAKKDGSDIRFKKDISILPNILDDLLSIDIISYTWSKEGESELDTIGISAQQLLGSGNPIFDRLVHERTDEFKTKFLDYDRFGVLAIKGLQEEVAIRDREIKELREKLENLENFLRVRLGY